MQKRKTSVHKKTVVEIEKVGAGIGIHCHRAPKKKEKLKNLQNLW